jgi:competence protein ComEC
LFEKAMMLPMRRPLAWFALFWTIGMSIGSALPAGLLSWKAAAIAAALAAIGAMLLAPGKRMLLLPLAVLASAAYYQGYDAQNVTRIDFTGKDAAEHAAASPITEAEVTAEGKIASPVEVEGDRVSFTMRVAAIRSGETELTGVRESVQVSIRLLRREEQALALAWGRGDSIRISGALKPPEPARNFGGFDYKLYLYRKQIHWLITAKGTEEIEVRPAAGFHPDILKRWNDELRQFLGRKTDELFKDPLHSGYMRSLVLGLREDLDPEVFQQFSQLGLTHILAISGLHVAVFAGGCVWLFRLFGLTREKTLTVTMALVPFYVALSGGSPSAVRAGIMGMLGLYAARRGLWKDMLNIIGLAAVAMLVWNPYYLHDVSFQLSFLVTLGLILGVPRFSRMLPVRPAALQSALSVTIVAQLVSFPITVYYFNSFSLLSFLANLLVTPLVSFLVLPLGTITLLAGLAFEPLGASIARIAILLNDFTFWAVDKGAQHDPFYLIWPKPSLLWIAFYYAGLAAVYAGWVRWKEDGRIPFAAVSLCALTLLLWHGYDPDRLKREGEVSFLDVGQGDAIVVRTPQGKHVLIDGGGTLSFRKPGEEWKERRDPYEVGKKLLVPLLKQRGVHRIDLMVVTHQDQDHIGGLQAVIEQIPVNAIVMNRTWKGNESSRQLFEKAAQKKIPIQTIPPGSRIPIDRHTEMTALGPAFPDEKAVIAEDQNPLSVVMHMRMYASSFLFTGDMRAQEEKAFLQGRSGLAESLRTALAPVDVMKVAHHGSKTSTGEDWLAFWKPAVSVISVGKNNVYGHPNPGVLERLEQSGTDIYRTDRNGEIAFTVTKNGMRITNKLEP